MIRRPLVMLAFLLLVVGGGLLIGFFNMPGPWYQALAKPPFNPPNWLFGPAWTILYVLIAIAGWRVWLRDQTSSLMKLWWLQLAFNFLWSPVFFGLERIAPALMVVTALLVTVIAFIGVGWRRDRASSLLFVPYAGWVAFATLLNLSIWLLN